MYDTHIVLSPPTIIPQSLQAKVTIITGAIKINLPYHPTTGTRVTYPSIKFQLQWHVMYVQGVVWPSKIGNLQHIIVMVGMVLCQKLGVPKLPWHQKDCKHHSLLTFEIFSHLILIPRHYFQPHRPTTDTDIIPHKTTSQIDYPLYIFACSILDTTKVISKATAEKQSGKWEQWYTFLTHTNAKYKFLYLLQQEDKKTLVLYFSASAQRNHFGTKNKKKLLHIEVKLSAPFMMAIQSDPA